MDDQVAVYTGLGSERAAELLKEHEAGYTEHPLSPQRTTLSESQALNWLVLLTWWDCNTSERLVGSGLSRRQFRAFEQSLVNTVCRAILGVDASYDSERYSDLASSVGVFNAAREALTNAWNEGVDDKKSHALATLVGLKPMGITLAETRNYKEVFERTLRLLHERTIALAQLLRAEKPTEAETNRTRMHAVDVRTWIAERPSDDEYQDSRETGTLPNDAWRAWAERMPSKEEIAAARIEEDESELSAMMNAIFKKTWIDAVDQVLDDGFPDEDYLAAFEGKEAETRYEELSPEDQAAFEEVVPGFSKAMAQVDQIEDDDLRAMARKRLFDQAAAISSQQAQKILDDMKREEWRESPAGRFVSFLIIIGVLTIIALAARSC